MDLKVGERDVGAALAKAVAKAGQGKWMKWMTRYMPHQVLGLGMQAEIGIQFNKEEEIGRETRRISTAKKNIEKHRGRSTAVPGRTRAAPTDLEWIPESQSNAQEGPKKR